MHYPIRAARSLAALVLLAGMLGSAPLALAETYTYVWSPYPYAYLVPNPTPLLCTTPAGVVAQGAPATFVAENGTGTYNWTADGQTYLNIGPVLNTTFTSTGVHTVSVSSSAETATCTVNVVPNGAYGTYRPNAAYAPAAPGVVVVAPTGGGRVAAGAPSIALPALPNTGFAPSSGAALAFAAALLLAAAILILPYARKAFAAVARALLG